MTKTLVDLDDQLIQEAQAIFGTSTKRATIEAAPADPVCRNRQLATLRWLAEGAPDLSDPDVMRGARR